MFLNEENARNRLNSSENLANKIRALRENKKLEIKGPVAFVREGKDLPRLPESVKEEIVERANSGIETQKEIARDLGITQGAVTYLKRSRNEAKSQEQRIDEDIKNLAVEKMMLAMGLITEDKLARIKAQDLASVAASMSKVVSNVSPRNQAPLVNLVVYAPEIRDESKFRVVELKRE